MASTSPDSPLIRVAERFFAAPQVSASDLAAARALGVALVINSRVEGESPGQPSGAEMAAAAAAAGLAYIEIPVGPGGLSHEHLDRFASAVEAADGAVLGFCRSGFRSVMLRAFALAREGAAPDQLIHEAADAGFDLTNYRGVLAALGEDR